MASKQHNNPYQPHLILPDNPNGKDFIVSDLHGHYEQLLAQLNSVNFSKSQDRLICVGDLIDRGPESQQCLALLDQPWFYSVRGNHEQMLIDTINEQTDSQWSRWLMNGGSWVLNEADAAAAQWASILNLLPLTISLQRLDCRVGICHAEYNQEHWGDRYEADADTQMQWIWGRSRLKQNNGTPVQGIDWVFSGHTIVPDITLLGNSVFIERGAYQQNPLTLIDLDRFIAEHF